MFKNALVLLGLLGSFAASGCIVVDAPRRRHVIVVERPSHFHCR